MSESTEHWLPVVGYEEAFEVSDRGRVRSLPRPYVPKARILSGSPNKSGHWWVRLSYNGVAVSRTIHSLVMEAFVGPRPEDLETRHLDGDPSNNALDNLCYGTRRENRLDEVRLGTHKETRKTHCPRNHPYSSENTWVNPKNGWRVCRQCKREKRVR